MENDTLYLVMAVREQLTVELVGISPSMHDDIELSWADGMIGAAPIFDNYGDAQKYADKCDSNPRIVALKHGK